MTLTLSSNQETFATELAKDTGLNLDVVDAWLRNEEPAKTSNTVDGANNWLNVGITGSGSYGEDSSVWNNPTTAADATAAWLEGQPIGASSYSSTTYPGGGGTGSGILAAAKLAPAAQISAIQSSGFASGGETALDSLYNDATGGVNPLTGNALIKSSSTVGEAPVATTSSTTGASSTPAGTTTVAQGGYIDPAGGLFSSLNPFNAVVGVWDAILSDAKYAGVFVLALVIGGFLIMHGLGSGQNRTMPTFIPVPA